MDAIASGLTGSPRLLDRVRGRVRLKRYSLRTEQAYSDWIRRVIRFHGTHWLMACLLYGAGLRLI